MLKSIRQKLPSYDAESPDFVKEIGEFLEHPDSFLTDLSYASPEYQFVKNPQFVFFGYPRQAYN